MTFRPQQNEMMLALEQLLLPRLLAIMQSRAPGHCMRVLDLDDELMVALATSLRRELLETQVYVLTTADVVASDNNLFISSGKLVELRNPLADGSQRPPLLVFMPSDLRKSAEDSFGIATFEDIDLTNVYQELIEALLLRFPGSLQGHVRNILIYLQGQKWVWADLVAQVKFLLTSITNGVDGESIGASLFELGLIPDFHLFDDPPATHARIHRNLECVRKLTDSDLTIRGRVLELKLSDKTVLRRLVQFLVETSVDTPYAWTRNIVLSPTNWDISFDKWKFEEEISTDKVSIRVLRSDLPFVEETETNASLQGLVGQQILSPKQRKRFNIEFEVEPYPEQIRGLYHFTAQIFSVDGGSVSSLKKLKAWKGKRIKGTIGLDKLDRIDFEEGWHFVRILPRTEEGDPIPLSGLYGDGADDAPMPNESAPFYVTLAGAVDEEMPQRAVPQEISLAHARVRLQFAALGADRDPEQITVEEVRWSEKSSKARKLAQARLEIKFGRDGTIQIPVAPDLRAIELEMLKAPTSFMGWRLKIRPGHNTLQPATPRDWPRSEKLDQYLAARSRYFGVVTGDGGDLISQAADFLQLKESILEYATSYHELLVDLALRIEHGTGASPQEAMSLLRLLLTMDMVNVEVVDFRGRTREAALVGPTHPLRALWLGSWAQLSQQWLVETAKGPDEYIPAVRDALLRGLVLQNFPTTIPLHDGRVFIEVDNVHPFWSLYASTTEEDARGLVGDVCSALGLAEPSIGGTAITGELLASRIRRYVLQHQYIRTLRINAFNPGHARSLADAIVSLQKQEDLEHLRYDVHLFVPDPEASAAGEAIEELLSPTANVSSEVVDAFSTPTGNHLFPKLVLAIHQTQDFRVAPEDYGAHISFLFDLFPAEELGTSLPMRSEDMVAPLYGLIQDFASNFHDDGTRTFWQRQPRHADPQVLRDENDLTYLLILLPKIIAGATATISKGLAAFGERPLITLSLDVEQRALLHDVHEVSDWVYTIDRNMGIEFFDHGLMGDRPDYLIDYVPTSSFGSDHKLVITSRSLSELEAMVRPILVQHDLSAEPSHVSLILAQLRFLSGRLALKLISSPTQQQEALGLALARLFLEYQGALSNQVVMPLDAHLDLFRAAKQEADELGEATTLQRTDLALFSFDSSRRAVHCNLVEVKCYTSVGSMTSYNHLKDTITEQIRQSEETLRRHFDMHLKLTDRPDRLLKTREFRLLLEFYLDRAQRYHTITDGATLEARQFLDTLELGYELEFTRSALVFDFEKPGTEAPEHEAGVAFHRIGIDLIKALVVERSEPTNEVQAEQGRETTSVPRLDSASFLVPTREHPTSFSQATAPEQARVLGVDTSRGGAEPKSYESVTPSEPIVAPLHGPDPKEIKLAPFDKPPIQAVTSDRVSRHSDVASPGRNDISPVPSGRNAPYDVLLGAEDSTPQYGIIGEIAGRKIALDLDQTHTISLFGVQGGGKSYTLGSIIEMACMPIPNVNRLPSPLGTIVFHYSQTQDYKPEFVSMVEPNSEPKQLAALAERYGATPARLTDVTLLVPPQRLNLRRAEYPGLDVQPISFSANELKAMHWKFLMGAVGSQSMYLRQVNFIMRRLGEQLTLDKLLEAVDHSALSDHLKDLARIRLQFAAEYIDDTRRVSDVVRPGRLIIVDLRDDNIEKDEALGLFVVLLQIFSEATYNGERFNKLVVFDEAHKYIENSDLVAGLVEVIREMRHKGTSILVASQDPKSVPISVIELSSQMILHRFNSPDWLRHIQKANIAVHNLTPDKMSQLGPGEAYIWSSRATDEAFTRGALKIRCRPRVTQHGGATKTAVKRG